MRLFFYSLFCGGTILFALGTQEVHGTDDDSEWPCVAAISGLDRIAEIHIYNLLASKEIDCRIDTLIHGNISVPTPSAEKARMILRQDAIEGGYYMMFPDGERFQERKGTMVKLHQPISAVLAKDEFAADTAIGRWLRRPEMANVFRKYPFAESLEIRERTYLTDRDNLDVGYDVQVVLRDEPAGRAGFSGTYQILAKGMKIEFHGAREWGPFPRIRVSTARDVGPRDAQ